MSKSGEGKYDAHLIDDGRSEQGEREQRSIEAFRRDVSHTSSILEQLIYPCKYCHKGEHGFSQYDDAHYPIARYVFQSLRLCTTYLN
jgi:hypothetical protein